MNRNNLNEIRRIFEEKTGVELPETRPARRVLRTVAVVAAAVVCCLSVTAFAVVKFSSLAGDDLSLNAVYEGDGIVSVTVENRSDRKLCFQPQLKLMRWRTGEEVVPVSDGVEFGETEFAPHSVGVMTIDLSGAYDVEMLEEPLTDDHYYFILTNNNFTFGQDWMCSVTFAEPVVTPDEPIPEVQPDQTIVGQVPESLRFYFETITFEIDERRAMDEAYGLACAELLEAFDGNVVTPVSPDLVVDRPSAGVIFDSSVPVEEQYALVGEHWSSYNWNFKLLGRDMSDDALVLSVLLPLSTYPDAGADLPVLYLFFYEKESVECGENYAFIYGQLRSFAELEEYRVYEDELYVCYEVSGLVYSDLWEHTESFVSHRGDIRFDEQAWARVENLYAYFRENVGELIDYR